MTLRRFRYASSSMGALRGNMRHGFAARFAWSVYSSDAMYSIIPKNACSSLRFSIAIENGCIRGAEDYLWLGANFETFNPTLRELARAAYTFVVLRDPFARLASCFLDKFVAKKPPLWEYLTLTGRLQKHAGALCFAEFVAGLKEAGVLRGNIHWRPQADFLVYEDYDDVFAVERFADAVPVIERRAGFKVIDTRRITDHGIDSLALLPDDRDFSSCTIDRLAELRQGGEVPHPKSLYASESVALVRSLYAEDLGLYAKHTALPTMF